MAAPAPAFARAPQAAIAPNTAPASRLARIPFVSLAILALLSAVFAGEVHFALGIGPGMALDHRSLVTVGGVDRDLVLGAGEWWRLFTAPLLHGSLTHIIGNGVVFLLVGWLLEPLIGRGWYAATFVFGALGGALASMLLNPANLVSVGASGGLMALLSATFVCSFHDAAAAISKRLRIVSLRLLIPSLLPALISTGGNVDYNAHIGGALTGVAIGFILMIVWEEGDERPAFGGVVGVIAGAMLAASTAMFLLVAQNFGAHAANDPGLIPDSALPQTVDQAIAQSADLAARYPNDPRARFFRAMHFLDVHDIPDVQAQLQVALARMKATQSELPPQFEPDIRVMLAVTLAAQRRPTEAKAAVAGACNADDPSLAKPLAYLKNAGVCP
ncbi:MAG TPA: rhomboid family intramembrane serine protease [Rhizomicrobium sp.]|nr:rhomboid family intramembrane serine protease [Rhizomicrobium sp.]